MKFLSLVVVGLPPARSNCSYSKSGFTTYTCDGFVSCALGAVVRLLEVVGLLVRAVVEVDRAL